MRVRSYMATILFGVPLVAAGDDSAMDRLVAEMEKTADDFCSSHNTSGSLHEAAVVPVSDSDKPNLLVRYYYIVCDGVDKAPMKQGGFCGLTTEGIKCKVEEYEYRDGEYRLVKSSMQSPLE